MKRSNALFALFVLTAACGGYRPDLARGPHIHPSGWLAGRMQGRRLVFDRNGNIKETAVIQRECTLSNSTEGHCIDQESAYLPELRSGHSELRWSIRYTDGHTMILKMDDGRGHLVGSNLGALLMLRGARQIPYSTRTAHADVRFERLPGPGDPVLATETYSSWGIDLGVVQTFWVRN